MPLEPAVGPPFRDPLACYYIKHDGAFYDIERSLFHNCTNITLKGHFRPDGRLAISY